MASIRVLLSSSSLRRCMFSRSCRASLNDCKKVSKIPKNSSGCILPSSSPKCFRDLANCKETRTILNLDEGKGSNGYKQLLVITIDRHETQTKTKYPIVSTVSTKAQTSWVVLSVCICMPLLQFNCCYQNMQEHTPPHTHTRCENDCMISSLHGHSVQSKLSCGWCQSNAWSLPLHVHRERERERSQTRTSQDG